MITNTLKCIAKCILKPILEKYSIKKLDNDIGTIDELYQYAPQVILYLDGKAESAYQGNMWLKVLEEIDVKVAIVVRNYFIVYNLNKTTNPVFHLANFNDMEHLEKSGVQTILYPANPQSVTQSLRLYRLQHYFINHGESDKVVNQSKLLMAYDKLLVAGDLAKDRLLSSDLPVRNNQVIKVGRPQLKFLLEKQKNNDVQKILYAPTWEGFVEEANYTSISSYGLDLLSQLNKLSKEKNIEIFFKPHPFTGTTKRNSTHEYLKEMKKKSEQYNFTIIGKNDSIYEYMNISDLMITDISSTIIDYLYTNKPIILTNPKSISDDILKDDFKSSNATYILDDPKKLKELFMNMIENDFLKDRREEVSKYILGDTKNSFKKFNEVINASLIAK